MYWCPSTLDEPQRRIRIDRLLRRALAPLVGLAPEALRFDRESKGRPFLRHPGAPDFNLSDTGGGSLIAITAVGRVGVDLERTDRRPPVSRLAARWFGPEEARALQAMDDESARIAFLRLWTAKEASCKATGTGIYGYLSRWRFAADAVQPHLLGLPDDAGAAARWRFLRVTPGAAHTAVLALRDAPEPLVRPYTLTD